MSAGMRVGVSVPRSHRCVTCIFAMESAKLLFVKCEEAQSAGGGAGAGAGKRGVGRLVDSTQADDRRMIHLVRERPLLYARSNLPVASYHSQVKKLWREVADIMGWTVADVRRKWSHIRNSYSRHLRNEIHGVRTGRGRMVSRWYLADELEYLREHMATDTRSCPLSMVSFAPHFLSERSSEPLYLTSFEEGAVEAVVEVRTEAPAHEAPPPLASEAPAYFPPSDEASSSCEPEESASYFQFFRGIYKDYQELSPRRQRRFRRQCLVFLHRLVDAEEGGDEEEGEAGDALNLSSHRDSSDSDREGPGASGSARMH